MGNIAYEKRTVGYMISLYCRKNHGRKEGLCEDCQQLSSYAFQRLRKCPFGDDKPACKHCRVHCYNSEMRDKIRAAMRYSGPRMIIYYPIDFLKHLVTKKPLKP